MALPIQAQPGQGGQWMQSPQGITGIPPGLEYMSALDQIIVKQKIEILELLTGCEMQNKYDVLNSMGQQCYYAEEESEFCNRICCGPMREYVMHITDNSQQEVMRISHDFVCCVGCCWCATDSSCGYEVKIEAPVGNIIGYAKQQYVTCLQEVMSVRHEFVCCTGCCWCATNSSCGYEVAIEAPVGNIIGYAKQHTSAWKPHIRVLDANRQEMFVLRGPCCWGCQNVYCTDDIEFSVTDQAEDKYLGRMFKRWAGCGRETFTDADTFGVTFPLDMPVPAKALLFGAVFLVDFMYFERAKHSY